MIQYSLTLVIAVAILNCTSNAQKSLILNQDEISNILLEEYGDASSLKCYTQLLNYTTNFLSYPFFHMSQASSPDFTAYGNPALCQMLSNHSEFITIEL